MQRTFEIEELLSEAGWLRGLAASLTGDPARADDLVQDTWVAALRHPPRADDEARPWLARVVGKLARNARRGEARRAAREELVHEERVEPRPEELAQIAEAQRLLAEAVTRLPEGLRAVIVLRYFQGLDSSAAAARLGLSASAVRTRLQSALEALRADLDRRTKGGREAWAGMVAGLARANAKGAGTLAVSGATTSALLGPWVLALVIGASAVGLGVVLTKDGGNEREERVALGAGNVDDPAPSAQGSSPRASAAIAQAGTREAQAQPLASQAAPKATSSTQARGARISGTIRVDGRLPEWPLTVALAPPLPPPDKDGRRERVERFEQTLEPEERGGFTFVALPATWNGTLEVTDHTFANGAKELEIPAPCEGLVLELRSDPAAFGRLLDPQGQPCRGLQAACELHLGYTSKEDGLRGVVNFTTRDDGRFRIAHPGWGDFGELRLRVEAEGIGFLHHETPRFDPAQSLELGDLQLEPLRPLTFRVRDPRGRPIAQVLARVDGAAWSMSVPTDAEGKATLLFAPDRRVAVRFEASRYEERVVELEGGSEVEIELQPVASLRVRLTGDWLGRADHVVVSAGAAAFLRDSAGWENVQQARRASGDGTPRIRSVSPAPASRHDYQFELSPEGTLSLVGLVPDVALSLEVRDVEEHVLAAASAAVGAQEWAELEIPVP